MDVARQLDVRHIAVGGSLLLIRACTPACIRHARRWLRRSGRAARTAPASARPARSTAATSGHSSAATAAAGSPTSAACGRSTAATSAAAGIGRHQRRLSHREHRRLNGHFLAALQLRLIEGHDHCRVALVIRRRHLIHVPFQHRVLRQGLLVRNVDIGNQLRCHRIALLCLLRIDGFVQLRPRLHHVNGLLRRLRGARGRSALRWCALRSRRLRCRRGLRCGLRR